MTRLAHTSRLLPIRRGGGSSGREASREAVDEADAVFAANRERLHRYIVARGAARHAQAILQAVHRALSSGDLAGRGLPANAMFRLAEDLIVERRVLSDARRTDAVTARAKADLADAALQTLGDRVAAVFRRHRVDGVPRQEVARELGIDLALVEHDLHLAYTALVELRERTADRLGG